MSKVRILSASVSTCDGGWRGRKVDWTSSTYAVCHRCNKLPNAARDAQTRDDVGSGMAASSTNET